jgi:hypothetical protein
MEIAKKILDYTLKVICACALFLLVYLWSGGRYEIKQEMGARLIKIDKITGNTYEYRVEGREHTSDDRKGTYRKSDGTKTYNDSIPKWYKMHPPTRYQ